MAFSFVVFEALILGLSTLYDNTFMLSFGEFCCPIFIGKKARIWRLPKGLMTGIAKIGGWLHLPLNPDRLQKLTENYVSTNDKIKSALGIDKMPVSAREGLQRTLESFR